jgi:hypothetical protein
MRRPKMTMPKRAKSRKEQAQLMRDYNVYLPLRGEIPLPPLNLQVTNGQAPPETIEQPRPSDPV